MKNQKGATLLGSLLAITILSTTFVALLNLQASIVRARFFLQNDNTANLLVSEGLEIFRSIYETGSVIPNGTNRYVLDYDSISLPSPLSGSNMCTESSVGVACDLDLPNSGNGYKISNTNTNKTFYRFIDVTVNGDIITATSTVVVKNPRGLDRVYKAMIELYKIN